MITGYKLWQGTGRLKHPNIHIIFPAPPPTPPYPFFSKHSIPYWRNCDSFVLFVFCLFGGGGALPSLIILVGVIILGNDA